MTAGVAGERELACGCLLAPMHRCRFHAAADAATRPEPPADIGAGQASVPGADIIVGRLIWRYTDQGARGRVRAWVPCHPGHSVAVPAADGAGYRVRCRSCGRVFDLALAGNIDEGYDAAWSLAPYEAIIETTTRYGGQP